MDAAQPPNSHEEDIFETAVNLEQSHFDEGFKEGYSDGLVFGKEDGREVGLKRGFEIGGELGFYRGCIDVWKSAVQIDHSCFSAGIQKGIVTMDNLLQKYPTLEPEDESADEILESLRLKFRSICATLNVKLDYDGYPKASSNIEF